MRAVMFAMSWSTNLSKVAIVAVTKFDSDLKLAKTNEIRVCYHVEVVFDPNKGPKEAYLIGRVLQVEPRKMFHFHYYYKMVVGK